MTSIHPKVAAAGVAGAITTIVVWIASAVGGIDVPGEVAAALTTIIASFGGWLKSS